MISIRLGGKVYGPGVFMSEDEAASVKTELLARNTKNSKRLADEIGMPQDGTAYADCLTSDRETVGEILDEMRRMSCSCTTEWSTVREWAHRLTKALKIERALGPAFYTVKA